jgi:S-adenosylmethionine/arginine decarboxylase-like enzyme
MKKKKKVFGWEVIMNLRGCDPEVIGSAEELKRYVKEICEKIEMKRYKRTIIYHFGYGEPHTKGYSLVQLIETSAITGHFSELWNSAYINIFSCKKFSYKEAIEFSLYFFKAKPELCEFHVIER